MKTKILTLVAATCLMAASVRATTMTFVTPVGATLNALPVEAQATFVTGADLLQITILNTIFNPTSVIQNVSGLGFTLSSGQTSGVLANSSGLFRTVNSNKTFTDGAVGPTDWTLTDLFLNALGGGPDQTIIGDPDGSKYTNAKGSIAGNGPHNPFLYGKVTFWVTIDGLTADDSVTSADFAFGTDLTRLPPPPSVPDGGATAVLLGLGLVSMSFIARRRLVA